jgi:hypothetical protein
MSGRYKVPIDRNVHAAFRRFSREGMRRRMLWVADALDGLVLRFRAARKARDWAVRKLR